MKKAIRIGIMVATVLMAGCHKKPSASSTPPPPAPASPTSPSRVAPPSERAIVTKAKGIVLPEFKLDGVTLSEAITQLSLAAKQNDPKNEGVNFMVMDSDTAKPTAKITLALKNATLAETIDQLAKAADVHVSAQDYAFVFDPTSGQP